MFPSIVVPKAHWENYVDREIEASMSVTKPWGSFGEAPLPLPDGRGHDHRGHVAQFYADDAFLIKSISRFIGRALGAGDCAIVVATPEHREALAGSLKRRGLNVARITEHGRYVALDAAEALSKFMIDGWPDAASFADAMGGLIVRTKAMSQGRERRLAVFGEMVSLLCVQGKLDAALHLEQLWNNLARVHSFALHCGYRMKDFYREDHGDLFSRICEEHSAVIPCESYAPLGNEEARLRNITHLQQRAAALENEITERRRVERELGLAHDELERRVLERTQQLQEKNDGILQQSQVVESANRNLQQLSARLLRVQDDERRSIARDLHDSAGQIVALISMNLCALEAEAQRTSPEIAKSISDNLQLVNQVSSELRTISYLLHPPLLDEMGLVSALHWYVEGFAQRSGIKVSLELACDFGRLSRELETAVFRVIQECLTNVHRHSESPSAAIRLCQSSDSVTLEVEDKGKGIAPEKQSGTAGAGVGLRSMRERIEDFQGQMEIASSKVGTLVKVVIPLAACTAAS
jgi:signal transduction histidine kinase